MIQLLSFDSTGKLTVAIRNKRYTYFDVNPYWKQRFEWWIKNKRYDLVFGILKKYSRKELFAHSRKEGS